MSKNINVTFNDGTKKQIEVKVNYELLCSTKGSQYGSNFYNDIASKIKELIPNWEMIEKLSDTACVEITDIKGEFNSFSEPAIDKIRDQIDNYALNVFEKIPDIEYNSAGVTLNLFDME